MCVVKREISFAIRQILHGGSVKTMAHIRLDPPEPFNSAKPGEWSRWKRRFYQFRVASGLDEEGDGRQVSTLLYCLKEHAEDVLTLAGIRGEDRKDNQKVVATVDKFFSVH